MKYRGNGVYIGNWKSLQELRQHICSKVSLRVSLAHVMKLNSALLGKIATTSFPGVPLPFRLCIKTTISLGLYFLSKNSRFCTLRFYRSEAEVRLPRFIFWSWLYWLDHLTQMTSRFWAWASSTVKQGYLVSTLIGLLQRLNEMCIIYKTLRIVTDI